MEHLQAQLQASSAAGSEDAVAMRSLQEQSQRATEQCSECRQASLRATQDSLVPAALITLRRRVGRACVADGLWPRRQVSFGSSLRTHRMSCRRSARGCSTRRSWV
jgi:hypothetical protein